MAYQSKHLSVMAYANGFTLWHYVADLKDGSPFAPDYFNAAADMLRQGDALIVNLKTDGGVVATGQVAVTGHHGGVVTVGEMGSIKVAVDAMVAHASDCAQHNPPAMPAGPCDCGAA